MGENHFTVTLLGQAVTPQAFAVQLVDRRGEGLVLPQIPPKPALVELDRALPTIDLAPILDELEGVAELRAPVDPARRLGVARVDEFRVRRLVDDPPASSGGTCRVPGTRVWTAATGSSDGSGADIGSYVPTTVDSPESGGAAGEQVNCEPVRYPTSGGD